MTPDLVAFLRARLAEEHEVAEREHRSWAGSNWDAVTGEADSMLVGLFSPARVLAEIAVKRAVLDRLVHEGGWELRHGVEHDEIVTYYWSSCSCGWEQQVDRNGDIEWAHDRHREDVGYNEAVTADIVRALVQPFAEHPEFHPSWPAELGDTLTRKSDGGG